MLKVSRADISTTEIQEFAVHERFIKLPIDKYLSLLGMTLNGPQIAILNALNSPKYRFVTAAVSRRVGKTTIANIIAQVIALVPGSAVLIMSPNYSLSSISFEEQRKLIKKFDLEVTRDNAKDRVIELSNGSSIRMGSISQVDSVVGRSYDLILFDEAALTSEGREAFEVALRPTLDKPNSKAIFISTPRGRLNWFSQYWQNGFSDLPAYSKWASIHADYLANPRANDEDIAEARATMSKAKFEQEYLASFSVFENQVYKFDTDKYVEEVDTSGMEHIMGIDVGFKDPTAMVVLAFDGERFYAVAEYLEANTTTDEHAEAYKLLDSKYDIQVSFIDSAAQQTRFDWAQNHNISTTNATKSVLDGIAYVQTIVETGRLVVSPRCRHTLAALDQYRWDPKPTLLKEKPLHDEFSHMADALRYAIYSYRANVGVY